MENWIKISKSEGTGDSEVSITPDYNITPSTRRATITAQASGGESDSLAFAQVGSFCPTLYTGDMGLSIDNIDWDNISNVPVFEIKGAGISGNIGMKVPYDFIRWLQDNGLSVWLKGSKVEFREEAGSDITHLLRYFVLVALSIYNNELEYKIGTTFEDSQPWCKFKYTQE